MKPEPTATGHPAEFPGDINDAGERIKPAPLAKVAEKVQELAKSSLAGGVPTIAAEKESEEMRKPPKQGSNSLRPVIVTTSHRGVFFGYASDTNGTTIKLERARLCIYWSADLRGFMGLASQGPNSNCRIGPPATITVRDITSVVEVEPKAVEAWENQPWKS